MSLPLLGRSIQNNARVSSGTIVFPAANSAGTRSEDVHFEVPFDRVPSVIASRSGSLGQASIVEIAIEAISTTQFTLHLSFLSPVGETSVCWIAA